ncbi:MAG: RidA family protein [Anaerolineae bacterium]
MGLRRVVQANDAPAAIGPYSHAIVVDPFVYTAGQGGLDPATGSLVPGGIEAQTRQTLVNIETILKAAGSSLANVVKTTVFLANIEDFPVMNRIYAQFFADQPPARTTVQAARLPLGALVEIEAIALLNKPAK